ncbi:hypothetical protein GGX14DRAFT_555208 [Mycena pura]|uniref:Uncharacterized protein n=1 Tax=Mycena pura TaxID=153505 RepID=A0AAD7E579_9AGAR|nr:hypothetical protein GGX14DRAFT_555208 [Mycena pura]
MDHGSDGHLRLFKMIPLACPERYVRTLPRQPSPRTDLQLRDTHTELSNIVLARGFWSAVGGALIKWVPYLSTAVGLFGLGECIWEWATKGATVSGATACVLGGAMTLIGIGGMFQANVAASLASANANANFELVTVTQAWAEAGTQTDFTPRAESGNFSTAYSALLQNWTVPGAYHHSSGNAVTLWDVAKANSTHPITVLHSLAAFQANHSHAVNVWSSVSNPDSGNPRLHLTVPFPYASSFASTPSTASRRQCVGVGEEFDCVTPGSTLPSGAPATMYYGFDLYGTQSEIEQYQDELGATDDATNDFEPSLVDMSNDIVSRQAWDTCVCEMQSNTWISTGSLQMSWDNTYNGFSPCFNSNCDNNAEVRSQLGS